MRLVLLTIFSTAYAGQILQEEDTTTPEIPHELDHNVQLYVGQTAHPAIVMPRIILSPKITYYFGNEGDELPARAIRHEESDTSELSKPMYRPKKILHPTRRRTGVQNSDRTSGRQRLRKENRANKLRSPIRSRSQSRSSASGEITPKPDATSTNTPKYDVWLAFRRRKYMVKRNAKSFDDAEASCQKLGAHLVSIHSEAENNFIHKITSDGSPIKNFNEFVFIGLRLNSKNEWEWTDGTYLNYKKWAVNQPDHLEHEKCGQFHQGPARLRFVQDYHWNSIDCGWHMKYYVCKKRN
ncbi:unnamed protein product [Cylicocyclus nassatus]|uniref:C-type lectin domain-containing protein n=1 Tax=Cylicocyclus nassatus TaxID=53992 RepID=A0AA36H0M8_CYLNA|nr:unnamed protein product [Cylicocyclus nassatus]